MKKEDALKQVISVVSESFIETILVGIEECPKEFPYTLAVANFIGELKEKNILVEFFGTFQDMITDRVFREIGNYLGR